MANAGRLRADADPRQLALAVFAALQGGLALSAMMESIEPLQATKPPPNPPSNRVTVHADGEASFSTEAEGPA